jgi:ergothioneine biosynthesis protein EgtB
MGTPHRLTREALRAGYDRVRAATLALSEPLSPEDQVVQSMPDASPTKWHLAHTTWFFETFVLAGLDDGAPGRAAFHPGFAVLFNSYYQGVGPQFPRPRRGLLSRPSLAEVHDYRRHVDGAMARLFETLPDARLREIAPRIELGLNHEEQHQELIVTDLKHLLAQNPLDPVYRPRPAREEQPRAAGGFTPARPGGLFEIGASGDRFFFDNESPIHKVYCDPFQLGRRLVTAGEYCEFIADGGYSRPDLWLSEGWNTVLAEGLRAPLYWREDEGRWTMMTLAGRRPVDPDEPVCHVSYYEADAFARWAGARLPREDEWELHARDAPIRGNFLEDGHFHPAPAQRTADGPAQMFGDVWEWTASAYLPYPGFAPLPGALGEYNGKFMSGQMVLRGGSCATPARHIRPTYRNFFPPSARWQITGFRLAR